MSTTPTLNCPASESTGAGRALDPAAVSPVPVAVPAGVSPRGASAGTAGPERPPSGPATKAPAGGASSAYADGANAPSAGSSPGLTGSPGGRAGTRASGTVPGRGDPANKPPRPGQGDTPRTWTLELPAGMELLSLNGREHWAARHRKAKALKDAAIVMARKAKLPRLERVSVVAEYQPPDRRHRDGDNIAPSAKALVDGLVAAQVLAGDDKRYVVGTFCMIGEPYPKGRLVLHLTEVTA